MIFFSSNKDLANFFLKLFSLTKNFLQEIKDSKIFRMLIHINLLFKIIKISLMLHKLNKKYQYPIQV